MHDYAAAFQYLQDDLPKTDHMLTSDMSLAEARSLWLRRSFLKKFEGKQNADADSKALELFLHSNERCKNFVL
jgi:cellobiose phosphorylase